MKSQCPHCSQDAGDAGHPEWRAESFAALDIEQHGVIEGSEPGMQTAPQPVVWLTVLAATCTRGQHQTDLIFFRIEYEIVDRLNTCSAPLRQPLILCIHRHGGRGRPYPTTRYRPRPRRRLSQVHAGLAVLVKRRVKHICSQTKQHIINIT